MKLCVRWVRGLVVAGCVLGGSVIAIGTVAVTGASIASAQTAATIVVEGNRRVDNDTIRSYFQAAGGGRLDAAAIDAGLKALYATGLFQDVQIRHSGGRVIVTVVENPVIDRVVFEGNNKTKDDQLASEVQSKPRGTLSRPVVQADVQRIIEIYRRSGRFDVRVEPKIIDRPNNRVDLVFEINEGGKTGVKRLVFVGNNSYSSYRLKEVIKTTESNLLNFLQTTDIYDPDRVEADRDLLRRYYLKHGFADVRIVSASAEYDPSRRGFIVTFTIDEGPRYRFGSVDIVSNVRAIDANALRARLRTKVGDYFNSEAVEKSVEDLTVEIAKRGYPFASVRPRGDRNYEAHLVNLVFVVDEGVRSYIERINIRGNTRTRDDVIRREFDISEGDPYNRALIDRAERRLKNLNYFKTVKISNEPGSAPDRVVVNVEVEEQATGQFSVAGGYSTIDGLMAEVAVGERNLLGTGRYAKAAVQYGQRVRGFDLSFAEPYFLDRRLLFAVDLFGRQTLASSYLSYDTKTIGGAVRFGIPLREDLSLQTRYSIYQQEVTLPALLRNCDNIAPDFINTFPTPAALAAATTAGAPYAGTTSCYADNEASLPVRRELASGKALTSLVGYTLAYNTLDNIRRPSSGLHAELKQDFAGVGGDVNFIRSTAEVRHYYEVTPDLVSLIKVQGGLLTGWGSKDLRMLDHFKLGPNLVRGFQPNGIGPRDVTPGTTNDALGGTMYWGATLELQYPFYFLPKDSGVRGAVFADAGSLWNYKGPTTWAATGEINGIVPRTAAPGTSFACACGMIFQDTAAIRASVGASIIWDSPFGPLRFDFAVPLLKESYDRTQWFRFGGGTTF
jgi:outer membrane protein insertion porin family